MKLILILFTKGTVKLNQLQDAYDLRGCGAGGAHPLGSPHTPSDPLSILLLDRIYCVLCTM